jgi:hypothetical protein
MPAMFAKTKVASQTIHPASATPRWQACQARAATEGMTSVTQNAWYAAIAKDQEQRSGGFRGAERAGAHPGEAERGGYEDDRSCRSA